MKVQLKNTQEIIRDFYRRPGQFWQEQKEAYCLGLFHKMAKKVPAYKKFLKQNSVSPNKIKTFSDFENLPFINKKNYFFKNNLTQTTWPSAYQKEGLVMTSTSGSTGKPTYFPRSETLDWQYSVIAEFFLKNGPKGSTLLIDCFGMGVWIGGLITYQAFRMCALRGLPVTVITPGINKKEIFHALRELAPNFNNVILAGYPPFIKDIVDEAKGEGVSFKKFYTRILTAAESFTEQFRDYLALHANVKNLYFDILNIYGSAELGAMAFETPLSIYIRRLALKHSSLKSKLFLPNKLPTLAQFNPLFTSFEEKNQQILITANSASPMLKYQIGDTGQVYNFDVLVRLLHSEQINLKKEADKLHIKLTPLPFIVVYARSDLSTKLYGAIIYPEHVKEALENSKFNSSLTGKFTMLTKTDKNHNQFLEIHLELKKHVSANKSLRSVVEKIITSKLLEKNAEYKNNYQIIPKKVTPRIIFWPNSHPTYFAVGVKQKWVKMS